MATGDIPVTGSAVGKDEQFTIDAKNPKPPDNLKVRTTTGKRLHIFVDTNTENPNSKKFDEDVNKEHWRMVITEI